EVPRIDTEPPSSMAEQEENIPEIIMSRNAKISTSHRAWECRTANSFNRPNTVPAPLAAFFVPFAVPPADFAPAAVLLADFAAAYCFLISWRCFQREMGLDAASGLSAMLFWNNASTLALSAFFSSLTAFR